MGSGSSTHGADHMTRASRFEGTIGRSVADSEAWFDDPPHPGDEAPNVVMVLLDDTGFAQFGCYGSDIDTPNVDALAAGGLQFTNFHVTPLCSPTRASLLTGRSQHAVGMRAVSNFRTGFPNQLGHISNHAATVAEVLRSEGYSTYCVGKWHLAPMEQCSAAGPFDQWPLARGFDRFYGFLDGETDQFQPESVTCDNHHDRAAGGTADEGYHVSEDMVDQADRSIDQRQQGVCGPTSPSSLYVAVRRDARTAPGARGATSPKYRGKYDEGWDVVRQRWFERQIELGVTTPETQLAPRNPGVDAWDDMPENQQKLACRLQEAFAAFLDHTDDQIGRLVDDLREMGELDNTVDHGAGRQRGVAGRRTLRRPARDEVLQRHPRGRPTQCHRPPRRHRRSHTATPTTRGAGPKCGNTPFKWYKQNTHEGGVHVPTRSCMLPAPSRRAKDSGGLRGQFVNVCTTSPPTLYDLIGGMTASRERYDGLEQLPVSGELV